MNVIRKWWIEWNPLRWRWGKSESEIKSMWFVYRGPIVRGYLRFR